MALLSSVSCAGGKKTEPAEDSALRFQAEWMAFDAAMAKASEENRYVVVDFYTDWCKWCKVMDQKTYSDSLVVKTLQEGFVAAKIDGESQEKITYRGKTMTQSEFTMGMKVSGFPSTLFMDSQGNVIGILPGYIEAPVFLKILDYVSSEAYKKVKLDDFLSGK
jgi:thioredoxin-related protein